MTAQVTALTWPTEPGSMVVATQMCHMPAHWFCLVGGVWINEVGVRVRSNNLKLVAVMCDADPGAEVNHR